MIGTALIRELISRGVRTLVLCHEGSPRNHVIPDHELVTKIYTSLGRFGELENTSGEAYDVFYHFAWEGTTGPGRNDMYLQNRNVKNALDAVHMAHRFGCHTFVGAGSQAEYGRVEGVLRPDTPAFPEMGYGIAKLCAGQMTREVAHQLGMKHIWSRILSVYGPCDGPNSMVMSTIHKLHDKEIPKTTKGEQLWDYLYSGDAAKALYLMGCNGRDGKVYVLGSGHVKPLLEYILEIREIVDPDGKLGIGEIPYAEKQVMYLCADITDINQDLGWVPETDFKDGIRKILREEYQK